jgi:tetratricopeptide (TPR) repeat protein
MLYRPLLLLSIVMAAYCCQAQRMNGFGSSDSSFGFNASLTGTVSDSSNRPIDGVRVELHDIMTGRSLADAFTLANGSFEITNIPRGTYEVVATAGVSEARSRLELDSDREISFRLPINKPGKSSQASISLSQLNIPGKARHMLEKAEEAFHKARIEEAFSFVQKALVAYPNYAKALVLRGVLNMQKGDNKDAQPDLEKAVELDYGNDMGFIALASLYNNEGEFDRARMTLDHGMSLNPQSWQANLEMARAELGKGDFGAAVRSLDHAQMFATPQVTLVHLYRAQAFIGLKDYQAAIGELENYLNKNPHDANSDMARNTLTKLKEFTASAQK